MGVTSSFLSCKRLKLKLRVFLAGHMVAMVTCCVTKITPTILLGRSKETLSQGIWADSVSPRMNTIASLDQFQPRRSGENFVVICNDI